MTGFNKDDQRFLDSVDLSVASTPQPPQKEIKSPGLVELLREGIKALWEKIFSEKS